MIERTRRGFTLVEIMLVVTIIIILASISIPVMRAYRQTVHVKGCKNNMHLIESACRANEVKTGRIETDIDKLVGTSGTGFLKWKPECPVGGTYKIEVDPTTEEIKVSCSAANDDDHKVEEEKKE